MAKKSPPIPKLTRPVSAGVYPRRRLFRLLDESRKSPVIWICGPPGSGKTTLVSSYVESKRLRHVWYQVDEGDHDAATFIYYLGLAVRRESPRIRRPLPVLSPEYLPGLPVFTRRFFEEICARLKTPALLVFDNFQKMAADARFQPIIPEALANLPSGISAILVSRETPPPACARLRANRLMATIGWKDLRLTAEETEGIVRAAGRGAWKPAPETIRHLQRRSDGWAAGLILMLEHDIPGGRGPKGGRRAADEILEYFGGEIFDTTDRETREFLLRSAFLTRMTVPMAERLTGYAGAGRVLTYLHRHHFFTEAHHHDEPAYEYHALFREFLLARAKAVLPAGEIAELQRAAAELLEERGQVEESVALLRECGEWDELRRVVLSHCPSLVAQGRFRTLGEWLRSFPPDMLADAPWLRYWMGVSCMPFHPRESRSHFEHAFRKFREQGDVPGIFLSWSGAVESIVYGLGGHRAVVPWIRTLNDILAEFKEFPAKETGDRVTCSMMKAIGFSYDEGRACTDENLWVERTFSVARTAADISVKAEALNGLFSYMMGKDFRKTEMVIEMLRGLTRQPGVPPLTRLLALSLEAPHAIIGGAFDRCMKVVAEGLELSAATGARFFDFLLIGHGALCSLITGNIASANDFLEKVATARDIPRAFAGGFHHYLSAWDAIVGKDPAKARFHSDQSVKLCEESGYGWAVFCALFQRAFLSFESGTHEQAIERLAIARRVFTGGGDYPEFSCSLAEAYFLIRKGEEEAALEPLKAGLKVGRETGLGGVYMWYPGFLELLAAKALEEGIEPEYVRELIRKNRLVPGEAQIGLEQWPWPVKVRTLGGFEILRGGKPLSFSRKVQQKPLAMLKVLLALGGMEVPEERITDILWPETEGDLSHQSFATTLRRLRVLLGDERAISLRDGRLSLDDRRCWTDVRAMNLLIAEADREKESRAVSPSRQRKIISRILELYRGPFLSGEGDHPAVAAFRERLRTRFMRCVSDCGRNLEAAGDWEAAVSCYRKGLEVDELAEEFYRGLMGCYMRMGRTAEAVSAYRRCRKALSSHLGVDPSRETEALYRSMVNGQE